MGYLYELVDVSRNEVIDEFGYFSGLGECLDAAARRARRFPRNTLIRFDIYGPSAGEHVVSLSVGALQARGRPAARTQ